MSSEDEPALAKVSFRRMGAASPCPVGRSRPLMVWFLNVIAGLRGSGASILPSTERFAVSLPLSFPPEQPYVMKE